MDNELQKRNRNIFKISRMNEKQKIVAILMEALRVAGINKLKGVRYSTRVQCYKDSEKLNQLKIDLKSKIELFENMNIECDSYKHIHNNAKNALPRLCQKKPEYTFHAWELINNFLNLTDVFKKNNLKFIGIREVEENGKIQKEVHNPGIPPKITHGNGNYKVNHLAVGIKGNDLVRIKKQEIEIDEMLQGIEI